MPFDLFKDTEEELELARIEAQEKRSRLAHIETELELYRHPSWSYMQGRLQLIEKHDMEAMIGAAPEDLSNLQTRVKLVRHLLEVPVNLEIERAQIRAQIEAPEGE